MLHLDFGIDAGGEGEVLEAVDGLGGGIADVNQALVDFHFKSFATSLVDMWRLHDGEGATLGGKGHGTRNAGAGADGGIDNLLGRLVDDAVVISLEANADFQAFGFGGFGGLGIRHGWLILSCSRTSADARRGGDECVELIVNLVVGLL